MGVGKHRSAVTRTLAVLLAFRFAAEQESSALVSHLERLWTPPVTSYTDTAGCFSGEKAVGELTVDRPPP